MDIATLADRLKINQRYLAAATGVLYWEALATFPEEYRLIWRDRRWTPMKMAFLVNKYWSVLGGLMILLMVLSLPISVETCSHTYWLLAFLITISTASCDVIVGIRVYSVYERSSTILAVLAFCFASELAAMVYACTRLIPVAFPSFLANVLDYHGCTAGNPNQRAKLNALLYWGPSILYNLVCLGLLIGRHVHLVHRYKSMGLLKRLVRDGVIYFLIIVAVDIPTIYLCAQSDPGLTTLNVWTSCVIKTTTCTRLVLGLRRGSRSPEGSDLRTASDTVVVGPPPVRSEI